jgi:hypothetical protein
VRYAIVLAEAPIHFGFGSLFGITIALLEAPHQFVTITVDFFEVVIGEISPPLLDFTSKLLPLPFQDICVHRFLLAYMKP